jgi:hypothetical protein
LGRQEIIGYCVLIQSASLYLLIEELRPFMFSLIIERYFLILVVLFSFRLIYFFSFILINLRILLVCWIEHVDSPNSHVLSYQV